MQEVTCFNCHNRVRITPDMDHCSVCGEDLRGLLEPQVVSRYFGERAEALAADGKLENALLEVKRGLVYADLADLRLLGAILAQQLGRYDMMRQHVAAIPVDDSLRAEAEWLLRSHQDRQAALREGLKRGRGAAHAAPPAVLADVLGMPAEPPAQPRRARWLWPAVTAVLAVALVLSSWFVFQQGADLVKVLIAGFNGDDAGAEARQPATEPAPAQTNASPAPAEPSPTAAVTPATPTPIPQPTPAVPEDLVLQVTETPALADSSPGSAVTAAGAGNGFDLQKYLTDAGFPELAELPIEARLQDGKLILQGLVFMDVQRRDLLSLLSQTPGIQDVNAVDVLLRPKATYTVQDGDTLWSIVYDIYGDVERLEEFSAANLDVVPQPGLLRVGDVLEVPPVE